MSDPFLVPFKQRLATEKPKPQKRVERIQTEFKYNHSNEDTDKQRLSMAQKHIEDIKKEHERLMVGITDEETKPKSVLETLFNESIDQSKKQTSVSDDLHLSSTVITKTTRHLNKACTAVKINKNEQNKVYVASLNGKIMIYDLINNQYCGELTVPCIDKTKIRPEILSLAISHDNKYIVATTKNHHILIYDCSNNQLLGTLKGHQDIVTSCVFRDGTYELYSCSYDRSVKVWNIENISLMDTLYGHRSNINCIDALSKERCVTGSSDKSIRIFKVSEESQLIYNAYNEIECVSLLNETTYIAGSFDGTLSVYIVSKKTPKYILEAAHKQVTALCTIQYSDVIFSGGVEGIVKMWKINIPSSFKSSETLSLELLGEVNVGGCVNSIDVTKDHSAIVCAIGKRYRLGDWNKTENAVNGISIVKLH
ncbi:U3 small nucleolar RNA-interacting protein, putative [Entamoeba dispar SAW760]|uniref:U3 small nucleolar RNA-interacting protein, putative n=1 Tax=Entamoeba dispar (strain ATCC PRA-260 / SAW760) TaxID=370354 RepID=B0EEG5_ENTDS|nr:U3 small nucleolar RNA-interacting protein, putative [Entamoeba dispar SAW760]EDR27079.1 U3 small nucleolar RNA-interacting protein, putative [Entamoeba dispar SAW760]|eukprot:EDR27079.1 U3 small nucleolar RNA-interacting protein, putative [Entamoeba dispar SAW760]